MPHPHMIVAVVALITGFTSSNTLDAQDQNADDLGKLKTLRNPFGHSPFGNAEPPGPKILDRKEIWGEELERGYRAKSREPLDDLLKAWHADSKPVTEDFLKKKLVFEQHAYEIYRAVFRPGKTKYLIIQDEVTVVIVDSDLREELTADRTALGMQRTKNLAETSTVVVKNFRPDLELPDDKKVLYLQDKYLARLVGFITQHERPFLLLRGDQYQWEENGSKERQDRLQYLNMNGTLGILSGHWATGWVFESQPTVSRIYLGSDMSRAIVLYRDHFEFGEALLEKVGTRSWKLLSARSYAIE